MFPHPLQGLVQGADGIPWVTFDYAEDTLIHSAQVAVVTDSPRACHQSAATSGLCTLPRVSDVQYSSE
jgi:hypothetical protein